MIKKVYVFIWKFFDLSFFSSSIFTVSRENININLTFTFKIALILFPSVWSRFNDSPRSFSDHQLLTKIQWIWNLFSNIYICFSSISVLYFERFSNRFCFFFLISLTCWTRCKLYVRPTVLPSVRRYIKPLVLNFSWSSVYSVVQYSRAIAKSFVWLDC